MHGLPSGESPGWGSKHWLTTEARIENFWNNEMEMVDTRTGDIYGYTVDFEQFMTVIEGGYALNDQVAVSLAVPYVSRFGGALDQPIDDYHKFVGADRFRRYEYPRSRDIWSVQKNGVEQLGSRSADGVGNLYAKMKWWFLKKPNAHRPEDAGLAISTQILLPVSSVQYSLTTGHNELSVLLHGGWDLFSRSSFWISAGLTKLAPNPVFSGWPMHQWAQMYEAWFNFNLNDKWDWILQVRLDSPLFDKNYLRFSYISTTDKSMSAERAASGWSALTAWRGTESVGLSYRLKENQSLKFYFMEDFNFGDNDGRRNFLYVHGAPDIALISQFQIFF